jgi:nucleoside-diphosphate-sugar epimerase
MTTALIGHTGFVGGNLARARRFDAHFNSRNFREIGGGNFSLVVCAGLSAAKWLANRDPAADWAAISALADVLRLVKADCFVLISTIDVYPRPREVDEDSIVDSADCQPYGGNRLRFERFIASQFPNVHILRLSALFGPGLKKNVLFDLLHDNLLETINPLSRFQWYDVQGLWRDIGLVMANQVRLVNLVNEPLATSELLTRFFPDKHVGATAAPAGYDVGTRHASMFGGSGRHIRRQAEVLEQISKFIVSERAQGTT